MPRPEQILADLANGTLSPSEATSLIARYLQSQGASAAEASAQASRMVAARRAPVAAPRSEVFPPTAPPQQGPAAAPFASFGPRGQRPSAPQEFDQTDIPFPFGLGGPNIPVPGLPGGGNVVALGGGAGPAGGGGTSFSPIPGLPGGGNVGLGQQGPGFTDPAFPFGINRDAFLANLAGDRSGRQQLFGGFLGRELEGRESPVSGPFRDFLENQFNPLEAQFLLRSGLGQLGPVFGALGTQQGGGQFQNFLKNAQPAGGQQFRDLLRDASELLRIPGSALGNAQTGFRNFLQEQPQQQFNLALQSVLPDVPFAFRGPFIEQAQRKFNQFFTKTPDVPFLPQFVQGGFGF